MRDTILCLCDLTGVMARPWVEHGYQAVKNMNPMPGEEPPEYTPNPYRKENA